MYIRRKNVKILFYIVAFVLITGVIGFLTSSESFVMEIVTTLGTIIGMFFLYLEFRRSRNIEEANFISNLNSQFNNDSQIQKIYKKINGMKKNTIFDYYNMIAEQKKEQSYLTDDEISASVSFFTFFETINILIKKNIITLELIDDLFAGRFFQITNDPVIQDLKLVKNKNFYLNIYDLHKTWIEYRIMNKKQPLLHKTSLSDYYSYKFENYDFRPLTFDNLDEFISLQSLVHASLKNKDLFSKIEKETVSKIILDEKSKCYTIIELNKNKMVSAGLLTTSDFCNIRFYEDFLKEYEKKEIFYMKTMMVAPNHRGLSMQKELINKMLLDAQFSKARLVVLVVHRLNSYSISNFEKAGFKHHKEISLDANFKRNIMIKEIV